MFKIDKYDRKILYELDMDSRQSAQKIAKKVRLSKVSIIQRINNLKEKGIIRNFITLINYRKFGKTNYHVYYSLKNLSQKKEEEFIQFLKGDKDVRYVIQIDSKWDLMIALFTESSEETDEILRKISEKYGEYIREIMVFTIVTTFYPGRNYLIHEKGVEFNLLVRKRTRPLNVDKIDKKILHAISLNARASLINLSQRIGVSTGVLAYRIKKLKSQEVIQRFTID